MAYFPLQQTEMIKLYQEWYHDTCPVITGYTWSIKHLNNAQGNLIEVISHDKVKYN